MEKDDQVTTTPRKSPIVKQDIQDLISAFNGEKSLHVITARVNSELFEKDLEDLTNLYNLYKKNFSAIDPDGLDSSLKEQFSTSFNKKLNSYMTKLSIEVTKEKNLNAVVAVGALVSEYQFEFEPFFKDRLKENILKQREKCRERINIFFEELNEHLKKINNQEHILVTMQEAFLNYFNNPPGIGDFLPFEEEDYNSFLKSLSQFSTKYQNVLFVPNVIYSKKISSYDYYKELFNELVKTSYFEASKVVERFDDLRGSNIEDASAIQNKSFLFWRGHQFFEHQKKYILNTDIPLEWFPNHFYFPGSDVHTQNKGIGTYFSIDICQDHVRKAHSERYLPSSIFYIVQSASIDLENSVLRDKKYTGIVIHADAKEEKSEVLSYINGKETLIESEDHPNSKTSLFLFKRWKLQDHLKQHYVQRNNISLDSILKEIQD